MAVKKGGLGRGLDSLFADTGGALASAESGEISMLPLRDIEPDRLQPRKTFEEGPLRELAKSIQEHGVLQPIIVRPAPSGGYKIVAGERRWRAAHQAGLWEIPALVKQLTDLEAMQLALIENLQREDLDPIEEALGYRQLMENFGFTQEQVAEKVSRSRSTVTNSLRLLSLPSEVVDALQGGLLSVGHAKAILGFSSKEEQKQAADAIISKKMSVRDAEKFCRNLQKKPGPAKAVSPRPSIAAEVEISLRDTLGTEAKVQYKDGQGTLSIGFYSDEQLREFAKRLAGEVYNDGR